MSVMTVPASTLVPAGGSIVATDGVASSLRVNAQAPSVSLQVATTSFTSTSTEWGLVTGSPRKSPEMGFITCSSDATWITESSVQMSVPAHRCGPS